MMDVDDDQVIHVSRNVSSTPASPTTASPNAVSPNAASPEDDDVNVPNVNKDPDLEPTIKSLPREHKLFIDLLYTSAVPRLTDS